MKRDLLVTIAGVLIVCAICFGLTASRHLQPPPPTPPAAAAAPGGSTPLPAAAAPGTVIMRVNGEPVTDREFALFVQSLQPEQVQRLAATGNPREKIAEQFVQMKVLEQEARRLGAATDPDVATRMKFGQTNVYIEYAVRKLAVAPTDAELRAAYEKEKPKLGAADLSHILIAYRGGEAPARGGAEAPPLAEAMKRAQAVASQLRSGASFADAARQVSDDVQSAQQGGELGPVPPGALPPELDAVVGKLGPGEISAPVRSQFGVHIFKVNSRRAQSFEEVKQALEQKLRQENLQAAIQRLQKSARVEKDPKFFQAPPQPPHG